MRKYSGLNLDDPLGHEMLKLHFVTNSWPDITKKLKTSRKLEGQKSGGIIERGPKGLCEMR
jgi:hypothetical protein